MREDLLRAERDPRRALGRERERLVVEFVWIDCAPPATAEGACTATRTMLFSGCWAVRVDPPVCAWNRRACAFGFVAPKRSAMIDAQRRRAARNTDLLEEVVVRVEEEREARAELVGESPAATASQYAIPFASVNASSCTAVEPASRMW